MAIRIQSFKNFFRSEQIGGVILIFCVIISLIISNSGWSVGFNGLLSQKTGFENEYIHLNYSLSLWINDGLMAVFFLLVGLEIKREIIEGELSTASKAMLPIFAALGGMLVPAAIFALFNYHTPTATGWGIPMATDIAFALAILSLLGKRVPTSLKVFLSALAIADDLGAILVIAIFYTAELHASQLYYSAAILAGLVVMNMLGVKKLVFYLIPGVFLWYFVHHSGIHATIAGVLLALTIPTNPVKDASPLEKLEHLIVRPVTFIIMPLFALANTNIRFESSMIAGLYSPLGLGIIMGLVLGKPIGVTLLAWLSVKTGLSKLPHGAGWKHIAGLGLLAGIGFTMSVFIALLSFSDAEHHAEAKFAIIIASVLSGSAGYVFLSRLSKKTKA